MKFSLLVLATVLSSIASASNTLPSNVLDQCLVLNSETKAVLTVLVVNEDPLELKAILAEDRNLDGVITTESMVEGTSAGLSGEALEIKINDLSDGSVTADVKVVKDGRAVNGLKCIQSSAK